MMNAKAKLPGQTSHAKRRDFHIRRKGPDFSRSVRSPVNQIMYLQRTIGNQAVQGLFKSGAIQTYYQAGKPLNNKGQEADREAKGVVQTTSATGSQSIYRQADEDEKVQMMPEVQHQETPEEGELLQGKFESWNLKFLNSLFSGKVL